ncbi:MAG: hypothetical protein IKE70_05735 [Bacilli bacterium]|nr:hypothetical protein [Bacilli bacterium]
MANYDLYKSIDTANIKTKASEIKNQIPSNKSALSSHKETLTDDIWKSGAKATLTTAYDKIESEVYKELEDVLTNIETVCGYIDDYKTAENNAISYKNQKNEQLKINPKADVSSFDTLIVQEESKMDQAESGVKGVCGT